MRVALCAMPPALSLEPKRPASSNPAPATAQKKKVTVQLEFGIDTAFLKDPNFKTKLMFLAAMAFFFLFAAVMFQRSNMHVSDLFDAPRFAYHLSKLWSPAFILFLALYGASLGASAYYGYRLNWLPALFPLALALVLALALGAFMPALSQVWLALGVSVGSASLFASRHEKPSLGNGWQVSGMALMLFVILAFVFVFARASANKDAYFDLMLSGATQVAAGAAGGGSAAPGFGAQAVGSLLNGTIQALRLDAAFFRGVIRPSDIATIEPAARDACQQAGTVALVSSGVCQNMFTSNFPIVAQAGGGVFTGPIYNATIDRLVSLSPTLKQRIAEQVTAGVSQAAAAAPASGVNVTAALPAPSTLRGQLLQSLPPLKVAYDYLPYMVALSIASVFYTVGILARVVAALAAWGLTKVL